MPEDADMPRDVFLNTPKVTNPPGLSFPIYEDQIVSEILTTIALIVDCTNLWKSFYNIVFLLYITG